MGERTRPSMLLPTLPKYQLNHMVMIHTKWLLYLLKRMGRHAALSPLASHHSASLYLPSFEIYPGARLGLRWDDKGTDVVAPFLSKMALVRSYLHLQ